MSALYFKYQAFDAQGKMLNGQLSADTEREAVRILKGKKLERFMIKTVNELQMIERFIKRSIIIIKKAY